MLRANTQISFTLKNLTRRVGANHTFVQRSVKNFLYRPTVRALDDRWYTSSPVVSRKRKEEEIIQQIYDELPEIQTLNRPADMTDEDIDDLFEEVEERIREEEEARFVPNWKPGMRKRHIQVSYNLEDLIEGDDPNKEPRWTQLDMRCGMLAIKVGMMPYFDEWGIRHPCTILFADQNVVLGHKTQDKHGYIAVQVAAGQRKGKNVIKAIMGQYKDLMDNTEYEDDNPPNLVREFRVSDERWLIPLHTQIHARHFVPGQNVDVAGISKGKGFQGPMKRHGFKGFPASHGVSKYHRGHGSVGSCQDPGRVWKGKKMAGRMGCDRVTVQNLRVVKVDRGRNLIFVRGHVPGPRGRFLEVRDAKKKPLWRTDKVLANADGSIPDRPPLPTFTFDESIDGSGEAGYEDIMPPGQKDPLNYAEEFA
ncbi:hypothetical protein ACA910_014117 [Epithemia clementina (nom. ined.)]